MDLAQQRFLKQLGDRIRERRAALNMTQEELGERCDLHRTFIGSVERGERNVSVLNLRVIAQALRTRVADLVSDLK